MFSLVVEVNLLGIGQSPRLIICLIAHIFRAYHVSTAYIQLMYIHIAGTRRLYTLLAPNLVIFELVTPPIMIKMANSFSFRNFLRERRVEWENNLPLSDVITKIQADGYLSRYQYEELNSISNYTERRRKFVNLFLEKDERAVEYLFNLVRGLKGYSHLLPVQQDCEISKVSTSE